MPVPAIVHAISAPHTPVSVAKRRGKENTPAPTIPPTTIAVRVPTLTRPSPADAVPGSTGSVSATASLSSSDSAKWLPAMIAAHNIGVTGQSASISPVSEVKPSQLKTRERILQAAVAELVEVGLARFTTPAVSKRAHVSQGTLFRYFPTKADLLVGATEAAIQSAMNDYAGVLFSRLGSGEPGDPKSFVRAIVETLWDAYTDERALAAYEVRSLCRTDASMAQTMAPVMRSLDVGGGDVFAMLVPESFAISSEDLYRATRMITNSLQGRAFTRTSFPDERADETLISTLVDFVSAMIQTRSDPNQGAAEADAAPRHGRRGHDARPRKRNDVRRKTSSRHNKEKE